MKVHARLARTLLGIGIALAIVAAILAAACGDNGDEPPSPTATVPETEAPTAEPTVAVAEYPLTVTDMLGRSVTIDAAPAAVAALSPTTVEYVYAVGGTSLTRSSSVTFPSDATSALDVGPSYQPNFELIVAEGPDLIIADSVLQPQLMENLEGLDIPVLYAGAESFADVLAGLRLVGQVLDHSAEAEELAGDLEGLLANFQAVLPAEGPTVLILNGTPNDFYAAKPESYVGNLVDLLGAENVSAGAPDVGRFPGYTQLSLETILTSAPDLVLAITARSETTITESLSENPAWADVPAVQDGRVAEIDVEMFLQAPGPRVDQAIAKLAMLLYPEVFGP
jgi:iron complex transport system substrate-binding protein